MAYFSVGNCEYIKSDGRYTSIGIEKYSHHIVKKSNPIYVIYILHYYIFYLCMQDLCKIYINNIFYYKNIYLHIYTYKLIHLVLTVSL